MIGTHLLKRSLALLAVWTSFWCGACDDQASPTPERGTSSDMESTEFDDARVTGEGDQDVDQRMGERDTRDLSAPDMEPDMEPEEVDLTDELYRTDRLLEVSITMRGDDWDQLRAQRRTFVGLFRGEDCLDQPFGSPFTWFEASVTLDGETGQTFPRVEVKKKGFIGSLSEEKPGLKIDLGEFDRELNYLGARRLTLNNSVQDPSLIRQCLGYELIQEAGIPAPRCNFARVEVNGEPLGIYINIEPYKRPFFERQYGSYEGALYEGTLSDFTAQAINTFEPKNGDEERERSPDLLAVQEALEGSDDGLIERLSQVIDVDQFFTFWALESLLQHSDGYSGNRNNFYLYRDFEGDVEGDGRFQFLLWGIDGILGAYDVAEDEPTSVYRRGVLAWRLYQTEEGRRRYFEALDGLLDTLWDEERILARVDALKTLISGWVRDARDREVVEEEIERVARVIRDRRGAIERERAAGGPEAGEAASGPACLVPFGSVSATFDTTWGMINREPSEWFARQGQSLAVTFTEEDDPMILSVGSAAGSDFQYGPRLNVVGSLGPNSYVLVNVSLDEESWRSGAQEVWSEIYYSGAESGFEIVYIASAFVELMLDEGGSTQGDPIIGSLSGEILGWQE